jgi:hypothetical protein
MSPASCLAQCLQGGVAQHPFLNRNAPLLPSGHVTSDSGTGAFAAALRP